MDLRVILKADGRYTFCEDTMLAPLQMQLSQAAGEETLATGGIFPNPVTIGNAVSALVSSQDGTEITAEICDQLGRSIAGIQSVNGNGNWQKMSFAVPQAEGAYFLRLRAGGVSKTLPFRVIR